MQKFLHRLCKQSVSSSKDEKFSPALTEILKLVKHSTDVELGGCYENFIV